MAAATNTILSMTGFGDSVAEAGGTHYAVEIRSLNNRYFKPVIKLPDIVAGLEPEIESKLRDRLTRGSITCVLKMRVEGTGAAYVINKAALRAYIEQIQDVIGGGSSAAINVANLLNLPGVCQEPEGDGDHLARHGPTIRGNVKARPCTSTCRSTCR
jgi:uncharacterized protein (TIGR00255 family)